MFDFFLNASKCTAIFFSSFQFMKNFDEFFFVFVIIIEYSRSLPLLTIAGVKRLNRALKINRPHFRRKICSTIYAGCLLCACVFLISRTFTLEKNHEQFSAFGEKKIKNEIHNNNKHRQQQQNTDEKIRPDKLKLLLLLLRLQQRRREKNNTAVEPDYTIPITTRKKKETVFVILAKASAKCLFMETWMAQNDHADLTMSNATHYYRLLILLLHMYEWYVLMLLCVQIHTRTAFGLLILYEIL